MPTLIRPTSHRSCRFGFQILTAFQRPAFWIQNYLFLYNLLLYYTIINVYFLPRWQALDLFMFNILSRTIWMWVVKPGHPNDPQISNLPTSMPSTRASIWPHEDLNLHRKLFAHLQLYQINKLTNIIDKSPKFIYSYINTKIENTWLNSKCGQCGDRGVTFNHVNGCSKIAQNKYKTWYYLGEKDDWFASD